jgi:hypothetical protein
MTFLQRARYWISRQRHEAELAEEIEVHRLTVEEELTRAGLTPQEAAQASRRTVGNVLLAREDARSVWIRPWLEASSMGAPGLAVSVMMSVVYSRAGHYPGPRGPRRVKRV